MGIRFERYAQGFRFASLALDEAARSRILERGLTSLFAGNDEIALYPEGVTLSRDPDDIDKIKQFNNYDVLSIYKDGVLRRCYDDSSSENYFFVTGRCNSNCVMCPSPEGSRRGVPKADVPGLIELARHIPSDAPHLTITGGEPFLPGEEIFPFVRFLKDNFSSTEFLFLTNGRIFAMDKYVRLLEDSIPANSIVAIPIHGSRSAVHDSITQAEGSFEQTRRGIRQLLKIGIRVELRLVVSKLNVDDFDGMADLIISEFKDVEYVSVMAMEMTGSARANKDLVWIPYRESFSAISGALRKMMESGVDVKLYNFPICSVEKPFWTLCEKSISSSKVRFAESCDGCRYRHSCGGVFAGTFRLEKSELRAIL